MLPRCLCLARHECHRYSPAAKGTQTKTRPGEGTICSKRMDSLVVLEDVDSQIPCRVEQNPSNDSR